MKFDVERMRFYLEFVEERHRVYELRQIGAPTPWSRDPILASKKFTNVFRVLDPGSQFVFSLRGYSDEDTLMRLFLYRHTGRVEAWESLLEYSDGYMPSIDDLDAVLANWQDYRAAGNPIFTGAYLVYPQSSSPGTDKLESIIRLTQRLFGREGLAEEFLSATDQAGRFKALRRHKGVADFMSMQILTDWGYLYGPDLENDFVVPGPGCRKGISCITDTPDQVNFLHFARAEVLMGDNVPMLSFENETYRVPSIMDVQNTMCEFSKYVRYLEKGTTGYTPYKPAHPGEQPSPVLPTHWA